MIKIFYGVNRVKAQEEIRGFLGDDYEVIDGGDLVLTDLPSLLRGGSLFTSERAILIRDLAENKEVFGMIPEYLDTIHKVVILETKIDKRSSVYKELKGKVEIKEFVMPKDKNVGLVFDVYKTAKRDGRRAVKMVQDIKYEQEPLMFLGLMVSQAVRDYATLPGNKEKNALRELAKLDMQLKSTKMDPWILIEGFLLRLK